MDAARRLLWDAILAVSLRKDLGLEWITQFEGYSSIWLKDSLLLLDQDFHGVVEDTKWWIKTTVHSLQESEVFDWSNQFLLHKREKCRAAKTDPLQRECSYSSGRGAFIIDCWCNGRGNKAISSEATDMGYFDAKTVTILDRIVTPVGSRGFSKFCVLSSTVFPI